MNPELLIAAVEDNLAGVLRIVDGLSSSDWGLGTPCAGWSVKDVIAHVAGIESFFGGMPQPPAIWPDPQPMSASIACWVLCRGDSGSWPVLRRGRVSS